MIDSGEELDIVYTTDSLIVTISTDGHTSVAIGRQDKGAALSQSPRQTGKTDDHGLQIAAEI